MLGNEVDEVDGIDETVIGGRMRWPTLTFKVPPVDDDESLIACRPESWPMARGSYQRAPGSI